MSNSSLPLPPARPFNAQVLNHPLSRVLMASLAVIVPIALTQILVQQTLGKSMLHVWPQLLGAILCAASYTAYMSRVEKREVSELARDGPGRELGLGVGIGSVAFLVVIGTLLASGVFQVDGSNSWSTLLPPMAELILVALLEVILFRGIILRILETWVRRLPSLLLSSVLFAFAHLPDDGISMSGIAVTSVAGLMFGTSYLVTRRLWLPIGVHFSWNLMSDAVFSLSTSGHPANGLLQGHLYGADWLTGGTYGVEASFVTLVVITSATVWLTKVFQR